MSATPVFFSVGIIVLILLAALVVTGILLVWYGRRAGPGGSGPACGHCGYNLTGAPQNRCPECGRLFIEAGVVMGPSRRGPRGLVVAGVLLIVVPGLLGLSVVVLNVYGRAASGAARVAQAQAMAVQAQAVAAAKQAKAAEEVARLEALTTPQAATNASASATPE